jgi:hypothetical protein
MGNMFWGAKSFNQDISNWNVNKLKNTEFMFWQAESFDINNREKLLFWDIDDLVNNSNMFSSSYKSKL